MVFYVYIKNNFPQVSKNDSKNLNFKTISKIDPTKLEIWKKNELL